MAKTRAQKAEALQAIEQQLDQKGVVLFNHTGLKVLDLEDLRKQLRQEALSLTVAKRNLLLLALKNKGLEISKDQLHGPVAMAVGADEVMPAKVVATFKKKHEQVEFFYGIIDHSVIDAKQVAALATLPSKPELLAKAVGSIKAPLAGFVNVLAGNMRGLVNVLNAVKDKKPA